VRGRKGGDSSPAPLNILARMGPLQKGLRKVEGVLGLRKGVKASGEDRDRIEGTTAKQRLQEGVKWKLLRIRGGKEQEPEKEKGRQKPIVRAKLKDLPYPRRGAGKGEGEIGSRKTKWTIVRMSGMEDGKGPED